MIAPMLRARRHGNPCRTPGHGAGCERVGDRRPVERCQDKRQWQAELHRQGQLNLGTRRFL